MPYCRVNCIRLMDDDPRADNCDARDLQGIESLLTKGSPMVCEYCTGFAECDHPTWKSFAIQVECFDDTVTAKQLILAIEEGLGGRYGQVDVRRKKTYKEVR